MRRCVSGGGASAVCDTEERGSVEWVLHWCVDYGVDHTLGAVIDIMSLD